MQAKDNEAVEKWEENVNRAEEKVERAEEKVETAEEKVETAEEKVDRAKVELDRAKQEDDKAKEAAKASVAAGRGASACAVVAALPQGRCAFSCGPTVFAFWGHALLSASIPLVKPFSLCWLAALRGVACFALILRSFSSRFCLRLDFHVTVSVRRGQGSQPGFLMLAFSARTLKSSGVPARRVQAGGFCVGMLPLVCNTPACPGLLVVVRFRAVHRCCFLGCCFPLRIPLWLSCLHCVGLQHFGEREGLLAASGSGKSGCSLCFADASERGVSPRLEVGGSACFALALCSLSRLPLFLFEARLSGYCVREGRSRTTLGSSCLPLARGPLRAVGFRQDECRPGASAWACCLWLVAFLPARGSWSSCVFVPSTVVAFWGAAFLSARIPLWLSCLHCVGLQHFGEWEGLLEQGLGCSRFHANLVALRVLPGVGAGSEARGEGLSCSFVVAPEAQVSIPLFVCLATLFCCDLLGSGTASQTVGAKQAVV